MNRIQSYVKNNFDAITLYILAIIVGLSSSRLIHHYASFILIFVITATQFRLNLLTKDNIIKIGVILSLIVLPLIFKHHNNNWLELIKYACLLLAPFILKFFDWNKKNIFYFLQIIISFSLIYFFRLGFLSSSFTKGANYNGRMWPLYFTIFAFLALYLNVNENLFNESTTTLINIYFTIIIILNVVNIYLSGSRSLMISLGVFLVLSFFSFKKIIVKTISIGVLLMPLVLLVAIYLLYDSKMYNTLSSNYAQGFLTGRENIWIYYLNIFKQNPIFGLRYDPPLYVGSSGVLLDYHNLYLEILVKWGVFGLAAFLGVFFNRLVKINFNIDKFMHLCLYGYLSIIVLQATESTYLSVVEFAPPALLLAIVLFMNEKNNLKGGV